MKLYPKARPVRIKLVIGEEEHSSLESLRDNFDVKEIIRLSENGGLKNWLRQINNEEKIWKPLDEIRDLDTLPKYKEIFDLFFPDKKLSLKDRIFYLQKNHYKSFKNLFELLINNGDFALSEEDALTLQRVSAEKGDNETCKLLSKWFFEVIEKEWSKLFHLYEAKEESYNNYEFHRLMEQFARQWNVEKNSDIDSQSDVILEDVERIINVINSSELLNGYDCELQNPLKKCDIKYPLTPNEINYLCEQRDILNIAIDTIINFDFQVTTSEKKLMINLQNKISSFNFMAYNWWYKLSSSISEIAIENLTGKIMSWKWAIIRWVMIGMAFKENRSLKIIPYTPQEGKLSQIKKFLYKYGGQEKIKDGQEKIYQTIGGNILKNSKGINRLLFQTLLFISVICLYRDEKSISDLLDMGYRPAMVLFGNAKPINRLEKEFLSLDEIGKVKYFIKNMLEM